MRICATLFHFTRKEICVSKWYYYVYILIHCNFLLLSEKLVLNFFDRFMGNHIYNYKGNFSTSNNAAVRSTNMSCQRDPCLSFRKRVLVSREKDAFFYPIVKDVIKEFLRDFCKASYSSSFKNSPW